MARRRIALRNLLQILGCAGLLAGLYATRQYSYLLFHSLAEFASAVVAMSLFLVAWNSRRFQRDGSLVFLGTAFLAIGGVTILHTLAFKGMGVFAGYGANLATQLWITSRYLQLVTFLTFPLLIGRTARTGRFTFAVVGMAVVLVVLIYAGLFPTCYVDGVGLTSFKVVSEYVVGAGLLVAGALLYGRRQHLDRHVLDFLLGAIAADILGGLLFTLYTDVNGPANMLGHYAQLVSFYLIYRAIVVTGLMRPYDLLFRDLHRSEEALRESQASFQAIVATSTEGILVAGPDGIIQYANPAVERLFGTKECGPGSTCPMHPLQVGSFTRVPIRRLDGEEGIGEMSVTETRWHGRPGLLAVVRDITERKRVEQERAAMQARLTEADRLMMVGKLAASLAHEINNPMQAIIGCLGLANEALDEGGDAIRYLQVARDEIRRVARIVGQLREVHRPANAGDLISGDVGAVLERVRLLNDKQCEEKGVEMVYTPLTPLPTVMMVPDQIQQVFLNLVLNALDAMPGGGHLELCASASQDPEGVLITCHDTGTGIPADALPRIFDMFESTKAGGTGLGLFISRSIVNQHGGHIDVESRSGEGTTFTVWLPAASQVDRDALTLPGQNVLDEAPDPAN
ncbi:MAG: MASE3 domain-containing protein [Anaerolineae bacterium]